MLYLVGSTTTNTNVYFFGGQMLAQKVGSDALTYLHTNHQGSVVKTTGVAGDKKYTPYGAGRSGSVPTDRTYTGQKDDGAYLLYYGARYYDPRTGQFVSPDTIVPDPGNLFDYNRYLYVRGNPLKYNDPTGHDPLDQAWRDEFYSIHGRYPSSYDEFLRLFSVAFPSEWNEGLFYDGGGNMRDLGNIKIILHDTSRRSWDGLGDALQSLAGWYENGEARLFVQDTSFLFAGTRGRSQSGSGVYWQTGFYGDNLDVFIGPGGLPESLFVRPDGEYDADANVHHFVWAMAVGYDMTATGGRIINGAKEYSNAWGEGLSVDQSDLLLGGIGADFGWNLRNPANMSNLSTSLYEHLGYQP